MYLCIDIGGSKTIVAVVDESGEIKSKAKIKTPVDYEAFISAIESQVSNIKYDIKKCAVGVPGLINRDTGIVNALGNLPWKNQPIKADIAKIRGVEVIIENDARLSGLAEALAQAPNKKVLYLTIGTGIGAALIDNGQIVEELEDTEVGKMPLEYEGQITAWEDFAGGKAITAKFERQASEITDSKAWEQIGQAIAYGVGILCSDFQPEVIIFGGGVGQYADRFIPAVEYYLASNLHAVVRQPEALYGPKYGEDSVIRGCYEIIRSHG